MNIIWSKDSWSDYLWWQDHDRKTVKRINLLVKDILRGNENDSGLGKPELLRGDLSGWSSRRINSEHRLVYRVRNDAVEVISCRYRYGE